MPDSYDADYSDLDEYLAEYVDNAMDPDVRHVFEELLAQDPRLEEHVLCLREARMRLCNLQCSCAADPADFQRRLHELIDQETRADEFSIPGNSLRSRRIAGVCSLVLLLIVSVNMLAPERAEAPRDLGTSITATAGVSSPFTGTFRGFDSDVRPVIPAPPPYSLSTSSSSPQFAVHQRTGTMLNLAPRQEPPVLLHSQMLTVQLP